MLKNIMNLEGVAVLSKEQQKSVMGQYKYSWCKRRSGNLEDYRAGSQNAAPSAEGGVLNSNGCWVYPGMDWNAHPGCSPSSAMYGLVGGQVLLVKIFS